MGITVAVTGPTGEIGVSAVTALEREPAVDRIVAMARRPFEPPMRGWLKTSYHQGDILDRAVVDALVAQADVVIHLAFPTMASREDSADINLQGACNVFEATVAAQRPRRLVYTSSVAAYGYHSDNPVALTEDVPVRGSAEHLYSEQRAACEAALADISKDSSLDVFVLRPCLVAGPQAPGLANAVQWKRLQGPVRALGKIAKAIPMLKPVVPDPDFPLQLVHHDDVATAIALAAAAPVPPGAYNVAGTGEVSIADVAEALGCRSVRVPAPAASAASMAIGRLPVAPSAVDWLHVARTSVVMDTGKARRHLGWRPTHSSAETLAALAQAV